MNSDEVSKAFAEAIETGDVDVCQNLLDRHPELLNHPEWTPPPLHCAILWNQIEVVKMLLQNGADIELLDPDQSTTPLRYAIMFGKTTVIPVLLAAGADAGPIVEGGSTSLQLAKDAADGRFSEFDDLLSPEAYLGVIKVLKQFGISQ